MTLQLGKHTYPLDPAAVSAVRYRAAYGDSVVNHLLQAARTGGEERTAVLLRMCHSMIPKDARPELTSLAGEARKDVRFEPQARRAQRALLSPDPRAPRASAPAGRSDAFDEYQILALMTAAGLDMALLYELPILHLAGLVSRVFRLKSGAEERYRPMELEKRAELYPRRSSPKISS